MIVAGLVVAGLVGGGFAVNAKIESDRAEARAEVRAERREERREARESAEAEIEARRVACGELLGPWQESLEEIDSRLSVGLTQASLADLVGQTKVIYDQIDFDRMSDSHCLENVALPLEDAFKNYAEASGDWNDCITDLGCDVEGDVMDSIQEKWGEATVQIVLADTTLENYSPDEGGDGSV